MLSWHKVNIPLLLEPKSVFWWPCLILKHQKLFSVAILHTLQMSVTQPGDDLSDISEQTTIWLSKFGNIWNFADLVFSTSLFESNPTSQFSLKLENQEICCLILMLPSFDIDFCQGHPHWILSKSDGLAIVWTKLTSKTHLVHIVHLVSQVHLVATEVDL